jgi:N utilization substance protein A
LNYEVLEALNQIAQEKNVDRALVIETLKVGLLSAAKKRFGMSDNIEVEVEPGSGTIRVYAIKQVVETETESFTTISVGRAQEIDPAAGVGSTVRELLNFADFGRNAIQTAKQILVQRVREAEREKIFDDFHARIGEIATGTVQQVSRGEVFVNLGKTEAVLPPKEQIRKEKYRQGDTVRAYVSDVLRTTKGPQVVLSRTHPKFLMKLFHMEVPEVSEGLVEIKAVARDPGERSKIAVSSKEERIDPVGACVGMKGARVQAIVRELSNERIDIVPWSQDEATFLSRALSPAKVLRVALDRKDHRMVALVDEDQLSLAIGKAGQNARLAAQLTGWNIDIMTEGEYQERLKERQATRVALEDLEGVAPTLAEALKAIGIETANDLAVAPVRDLLQVPDMTQETAEGLQNTATGVVASVVAAYRTALKAARAEAEQAAAQALQEAEAARAAEAAAAVETASQDGGDSTESSSEGADAQQEEAPAPAREESDEPVTVPPETKTDAV